MTSETLFTAAGQSGSLIITGTAAVVNNLDVPTLNTAKVHAGLTAVWGGGSASHAFTITGMPSTAIPTANIVASANAVAVAKLVVTANTLTVTFTADPGAGTQLSYHYTDTAAS